MHKAIDKQVLKAVNKVLKAHNLRVALGQGSTTRYLVTRKFETRANVFVGWDTSVQGAVGYKQVRAPGAPLHEMRDVVRWSTVALAYGEALLDVLKDGTLKVQGIGENGWYVAQEAHYGPATFTAEQIEQLTALLD
jgi:hypothetical protein